MCKRLGHYTNACKNVKNLSWNEKHVTFAMMCYENCEEEKYKNGEEENRQESKNPDDNERKAYPPSRKIVFDQVSTHYKGLIPRVKAHPCWIGWTCSGVLNVCSSVLHLQDKHSTKLLN